MPAMPNITAVNALGDFEIAADRLAIIDGEGSYFCLCEVATSDAYASSS